MALMQLKLVDGSIARVGRSAVLEHIFNNNILISADTLDILLEQTNEEQLDLLESLKCIQGDVVTCVKERLEDIQVALDILGYEIIVKEKHQIEGERKTPEQKMKRLKYIECEGVIYEDWKSVWKVFIPADEFNRIDAIGQDDRFVQYNDNEILQFSFIYGNSKAVNDLLSKHNITIHFEDGTSIMPATQKELKLFAKL